MQSRSPAPVESVEDLGHSELLVRVFPAGHAFKPRALALDVRLAHGVRKTMVFALVDDGTEWVQVERLTPIASVSAPAAYPTGHTEAVSIDDSGCF